MLERGMRVLCYVWVSVFLTVMCCGGFDWRDFGKQSTKCATLAASGVLGQVVAELAKLAIHAVDGNTPEPHFVADVMPIAALYGVDAVLCAGGHLLEDAQEVAGPPGERCHALHPRARQYLQRLYTQEGLEQLRAAERAAKRGGRALDGGSP